MQKLEWGADTISAVRFNQTETSVLAGAGNDRTIILYDIRSGAPISRVVMEVSLSAFPRAGAAGWGAEADTSRRASWTYGHAPSRRWYR